MKIEDQIRIEKQEADLGWEWLMKEINKGNLDANMIALEMKRCNEVDRMIFKYEYEEDDI